MKTKIQVRRDTAANWTTNNPVLSTGEFGFESNTGKLKIGTGSTAWASLAYSTVLPSELDELAQDSINAALVAGTGLDKTYDDAGNTITLDIDSTVATLTGSQTLTNKTLTSPALTENATAVNLTVSGNLTVNGTTTNLNSTNLVVEDKNIVLGDTDTPTDTTADGGGITLKGSTDKTFNWVDSTDAWTSSEHVNVASGKNYYINGTLVKNTAETLTNKSLSLASNTVTGTLAEFNTAVSDANLVSIDGVETLTNKTLTSPTISNPTFTGQASGLEISFAQNIVFEGTTSNDFETTFSAGDPTADRTITLPDNTGTVALTSDIPSTTDFLTQGSTNKYFSDELAQDAVAQALASGTHTNITVTYSDEANSISLAAAPGYVDEQAVDAVAAAIAAGTHTNISIAYNDSANSISFTGADALPSQSGNAGKFLSTDGTNDSWVFPKIPTGASETSSPSEGQLYFNINANALKVYSGGAWLTVGAVSMDSGFPYTAVFEATYDAGSPDVEPTTPVFDGATVA
jgi:hypothetical protein